MSHINIQMKHYGKGHEIISIWNTYQQNMEQNQPHNRFTLEPVCSDDEIPTEHIFVYPKNRLTEDGSQTIFHQFNLDFDREHIILNKIQCNDRLTFFKSIVPYMSQTNQLDHVLILCQQTVFAYVLKDLYDVLKSNKLDHIIIDGGKSVKIHVNEIKEQCDIQIKVTKELLLIDAIDNDLVVNTVKLDIISESLFDPMIYAYTSFQFKLS